MEIKSFQQLLSNSKVKDLCDHFENQNKGRNYEFNLFKLISETYYKENFHSDIIKHLLTKDDNYKEGVKDGNTFLHLFTEYLKDNDQNGFYSPIKSSDFKNSIVKREEKRIDISIINESSKKAIIIENKINNAKDQERQLPTYYAKLKEGGYDVVAIVYLSLDGNKSPSVEGWTPEEKAALGPKILKLAAYSKNENDLVKGWLIKCERHIQDDNVKFFVRQYCKLLEGLSGDIMDIQVLKEFYEFTNKEGHFKTAVTISKMINSLGEYLAEEIVIWYSKERFAIPFEDEPYRKSPKNRVVFDQWLYKGCKICMVIDCTFEKYSIRVFDKYSKLTVDDNVHTVFKKFKFAQKDAEHTIDFLNLGNDSFFLFLKNVLQEMNLYRNT